MDVEKAKQVIDTEQKRHEDLREAPKVLEKERKRLKVEKQKQEDKKRKEEIEAMKKRFPKNLNEVFTVCWNCKKKVALNGTEKISGNRNVFRIAECSCGNFNVDKIDCSPKAGLDFEAFVREFA